LVAAFMAGALRASWTHLALGIGMLWYLAPGTVITLPALLLLTPRVRHLRGRE
jgi:hypothetical protein